jgi:hypothetical protein
MHLFMGDEREETVMKTARTFRGAPAAPSAPAPADPGTHFILEMAGGMGMPIGSTTADMRTDLALKFGFGGMAGSSLRLYWLFGLEGGFNSTTSSADPAAGLVVTSRTDAQVFTALRFLFPIAGNLRMFVDGGVGYGSTTITTSGDWITASEESGYPVLYTAAGLQYRLFRAMSIGTEVTYVDAIGWGAPGGVAPGSFKDGVAAVKLTLTVHF